MLIKIKNFNIFIMSWFFYIINQIKLWTKKKECDKKKILINKKKKKILKKKKKKKNWAKYKKYIII